METESVGISVPVEVSAITSFTGEFAFLSNFHHVPIIYGGHCYRTCEHAYQAQKAVAMKQEKYRLAIEQLKTAAGAKHAGRNLYNAMTPGQKEKWKDGSLDLMAELLQIKFEVPYLREALIATGERELVEGNNWGDRFWGMEKEENGVYVGENWLGRLIMAVRSGL